MTSPGGATHTVTPRDGDPVARGGVGGGEAGDAHVLAIGHATLQPAGAIRRANEALLLLAWGELSYAEIAVVTGDPIGTVRSRLNRARSRLRALLDASASEVA